MVLKNMRLERSKANGMIVVFILFGSVMNCCLAEAQKLQKSTAKQKQGGGQDTEMPKPKAVKRAVGKRWWSKRWWTGRWPFPAA